MTTYKGQCLCGSIKYAVDKIELKMGHCHCSMCRKFHGAAFATFGEARRENFHWIEGENLLRSYQAENGTVRRFCQQCGSSMTFAASAEHSDVVEFSLGTLETPLDIKPDVHIFVGSKANWSIICDGLPQYEGDRSSREIKD
jgi:hypothetical protein